MNRLRTSVLLLPAVLVVPLLAALGASPADAVAMSPCDLTQAPAGKTLYTWDGSAGDGQWKTPGNWTVEGPDPDGLPDADKAPNYFGDPASDDSQTGLVCVAPAVSTSIALDREVNVHVVALEVRPPVGVTATLNASNNARIWVYGPSDDYASRIHVRATVNLRASTLGGPGVVHVDGTVEWGEIGTGASALDNDLCAELVLAGEAVAACAAVNPLAPTGILRVEPGGLLVVDRRGVNFDDGYRIQVASLGKLRVVGAGYIAADRDTGITIEPGGTFELAGDGSVFEGHPNGAAALAAFTNNGTVRKVSGTGRSSLDVTYSGSGQVDVDAGGLSIANAGPVLADLKAGTRLGTGDCGQAGAADQETRTCTPATTAEDPQFAVLAPLADADQVSITEGTTTEPGSGDLQPAVEVEADDVDNDVVSTVDFEFNQSIPNLPVAARISIFQRRTGLAPVRIPLCRPGAVIPAQVVACVVGRKALSTGRIQVRVKARKPGGVWSLRPSGVDFKRLVSPLIGSRYGCQVMHPRYPYTSTQEILLRQAGVLRVRFATTENTSGGGTDLIAPFNAAAGTHKVPLRISKTGWVAAVTGPSGQLESSGAFRVIATPTLSFSRRSKVIVAGQTLRLRGVVKPGGVRSLRLYAVRVNKYGKGYLEPKRATARTAKNGTFLIKYKPSTSGRYVFAVKVTGAGGLSTAVSRAAIRVKVAAPRPRPVPTTEQDVTSTDRTTTAGTGTQIDPLDLLGAFYTGRATPCRFAVDYDR